ncbi:phage tail protein [Aeromonas veronii]|uniref:phage tail protein n=1 Tax=Aeromonas veronii TaxID=654 RepID=UPI003D19C0E8
MANVPETPSFDAGIYQIETTDPVLGGPNGIANAQAKGLANRTAFLKQQIDQLNSGQLTPDWIASQTYVQGELQKLDAKQSVRAATVANITLSGVQTIDGVVLTVGERVLVKDQAAAAQNGIYLVAAQGWVRSIDADNGTKLSSGARVAVEAGTSNAGSVWYLSTAGTINVGTTALTFVNEHRAASSSLPGVVILASVADAIAGTDEQKAVTPKGALEAAFSAYPVGAPIPWPTAVPPPGFIAMTGQSFNATSYPRLAQAYPSLVLPDMRAEFIRGWDAGRGIDTSRAILTQQLSENLSHLHGERYAFARSGSNPGGINSPSSAYAKSLWDPIADAPQGALKFSSSGVWTGSATGLDPSFSGGNESRPRNIAFNYIVRAA